MTAGRETALLTVGESARYLGVSQGRVYQLVADSRIPVDRRYGRILIRELDLWQFARLHRPAGRPVARL
jgi:excisionase family DNA binding protein